MLQDLGWDLTWLWGLSFCKEGGIADDGGAGPQILILLSKMIKKVIKKTLLRAEADENCLGEGDREREIRDSATD